MEKFHCCKMFVLVVATLAAAQDTSIDPSVLTSIFGTPPPYTEGRNNLEDITVRPTESPVTSVDQNGAVCKCVPYYLCDENRVAVDANNASVTGWGSLDIRFGEGDEPPRSCQESVEICCKAPKDPPKEKPKPDGSRLRGCGYSNPWGLGATVVGGNGNEAQFGEYPWVVALIDSLNETYIGVGVLIHPQVVMTGAHVIANKYGPGKFKVRAGEWDTATVKEMFDYQERGVQEVYTHQDFKPKSLKNDIALLRLERPVQLADHINMLCLPNQDESFDEYKKCVANGWGKDNFGKSGRYAVILKKVEVDMVPNERCNSLLRQTRLGSHFNLHGSFVCAGGEEGKDTCQGDGGAPLACPIGNSRYKLSGLVAWGIGCGQKDVPAVYSSVAKFRNWVDDKMNEWGYGVNTYTI